MGVESATPAAEQQLMHQEGDVLGHSQPGWPYSLSLNLCCLGSVLCQLSVFSVGISILSFVSVT